MNIKTHTFNGVKYDIDFCGPIDGYASQGGKDETMMITCPMDSPQFLETVLHESLHACNWTATEENVLVTAKDIARLLKRIGYVNARER